MGSETAKFDLTLSMSEAGDRIGGGFSYSTDLFDDVTIKQMSANFETLLQGIVADPGQRVSELPILTKAQKEQVLVEWNKTSAPYPETSTIPQLFQQQVDRTPDAVAIVCGNRNISYRELDGRSNQLARYLKEISVGPESKVGILMERSAEMVIAMIGVLKAGGAYVPLDTAWPEARVSYVAEEAGIEVVITQEGLSYEQEGVKEVRIDSEWEEISQRSSERVESGAKEENLAYVIYTSGSTGRPKGVMIQHRSVVNFWVALNQVLSDSYSDKLKVAFSITMSFDASLQPFTQLLSGDSLYIVTNQVKEDAEAFLDFVQQHQLDVLHVTPSQLRPLIEAGLGEQTGHNPRIVLVGGEQIPQSLWERMQKSSKTNYFNVYGPTECTVEVIASHIQHAKPFPVIGRPMDNSNVYVLDNELQPLPIGVTGELYIGGVGVGRGYLNRPDATAESFIPNPFSDQPGERIYKTGDLVRYLPDGQIDCLGRQDYQVKIRGYRIELGEIEAALEEHAAIREAVTIVETDMSGNNSLIAYVVLDQQQDLTTNEIRNYLRDRLPEYMVPPVITVIESMPLTSSGKVDHRALPAPDRTRSGLVERRIMPQTPVQEILGGIWREMLRIDSISLEDNFFEIGGHSLLATQVMSRARQAFNIEIALRQLFEHPTLGEFAQCVEAALREGSASNVPPIVKLSREGDLALSYAQQRLWFLDQMEPDNPFYNIPVAVRIEGELNIEALERSFSELVRRHEALRTTFSVVEGDPVQVINSAERVSLPIYDLSHLEEDQREQQAEALVKEEWQMPFDLSAGPLLRVKLIKMSKDEHIAMMTIHHIVSDGWSTGVLIKEVAALYEAYCRGEESPLPELEVQYADFAAWQREYLRGEVLDQQINYWKQQLEGAPAVLDLPTDRPRPAVMTLRGAVSYFTLPEELSQGIKRLSNKEGATLFMTLLAAFKVLLYRYTRQTDIPIGTPIAGRNREETEGLIGFFVNTLVLRSEIDGRGSFREALKAEREVALKAYAHQDLPFERLVEELQPERSMSHSPVFQVMFVLQNAPREKMEVTGITLREMSMGSETAKFDLTLVMSEAGDRIGGGFSYSTDLFDDVTIKQMQLHYEKLLNSILAQPDVSLDDLEMISKEESSFLKESIVIEELDESFSL
jgi:amino acid adenylation domain-containing protein